MLTAITLLGTNVSFSQGMFKDVPFPKVGYVGFLEGRCFCLQFPIIVHGFMDCSKEFFMLMACPAVDG